MKYLFMAFIALVLVTGCKKDKGTAGDITFTGVLKVQGFTTYQYGTHTISNGAKVYALRSSSIMLDKYKDQTVTISGNKVPGYPVENGPDYIEVTSVTK